MENDPQVRAGLSQRLQELRLENQMTQAELARLLRYSSAGVVFVRKG